jgi:stage III sporulation protein SpoIIIAA
VEERVARLETTDDLDALLDALPPEIIERVRDLGSRADLLEVVLDLGRRPEARFTHGEELLLDREVTEADIGWVVDRIGVFGDDNRAGIERTLHRISAIRNRSGKVVGLTCRIGRAVFGTIDIIRDIVESGQSLLILGRPGIGKTTMLREVARVLADDLGKRVVVVPTEQHAVMIEAVENHMPEVIVIDEIGTELEAIAARTIAERGVQLVGTAHGNTLDNLMLNPTLSDLIGGIQTVTLGDEEARRRGTQKSVLERKAPPTFDVVVEIVERDRVIVHRSVAETIDAILRGHMVPPESRWREEGEVRAATKYDYRIHEAASSSSGSMFVTPEPGSHGTFSRRSGLSGLQPLPGGRGQGSIEEAMLASDRSSDAAQATTVRQRETRVASMRPMALFPYGVSRKRLEQAVRELGVPVTVARDLEDADAVITLRTYYRRKPPALRDAEAGGTPLFVLKTNTMLQMESMLANLYELEANPQEAALRETAEAIGLVEESGRSMELAPQNAYVRRLQHQMAEQHNLMSRSRGSEPNRRVQLLPDEGRAWR